MSAAFQATTAIPVAQIHRSRADFPRSRIRYEVHLKLHGLRGLSDLCLALDQAQLRLESLKAARDGSVFCVLGDDGSANLDGLAARMDQAAQLVTWTTQIDY